MIGSNGNNGVGRVWLSTAEEIAKAIGRNRHAIPQLVKHENLPAFKFYGQWTALHTDIDRWSRKMAVKYSNNKDILK